MFIDSLNTIVLTVMRVTLNESTELYDNWLKAPIYEI